jgi:hypothetical protein
MEETAEQDTSAHLTSFILTDDGQSGGSVRRLKLERPVGTVPVVVLDVDPKDLLQMAAPTISCQSRHSARTVPTHRSA